MAYDSKYTQNKNNTGDHGHWRGTPSGSNYTGSCWCCARGCAVLCILAIKEEEPTETNIKKYLNSSADVVWSTAGFSEQSGSYPAIGQYKGRTHYAVIKSVEGNSLKIWDPEKGVDTVSPTKFSAIYYKK